MSILNSRQRGKLKIAATVPLLQTQSLPQGPYIFVGALPSSPQAVRQYLALKNFGRNSYNTVTHQVDVVMKKGSEIYVGEVAPQISKAGKVYKGGGTQVFAEFWATRKCGKNRVF